MTSNVIYLILFIVLFMLATVGVFVWYKIWKNKKWDRIK